MCLIKEQLQVIGGCMIVCTLSQDMQGSTAVCHQFPNTSTYIVIRPNVFGRNVVKKKSYRISAEILSTYLCSLLRVCSL